MQSGTYCLWKRSVIQAGEQQMSVEGGTSKSKREGDYLHFVQQDCFETYYSNNSS